MKKPKHKRSRSNVAILDAQPSTFFSLPSTLLAATAGLFDNAKKWKLTCLLVAVCSAGATVTAKLQTAEQLTEASECVGQLKALKVETIAPTYDLEHVSEKYQQILSEFSMIDC